MKMTEEEKREQWTRYIKYLMLWANDHDDYCYEGMSPACYDEFCDNDDEPEYYNGISLELKVKEKRYVKI